MDDAQPVRKSKRLRTLLTCYGLTTLAILTPAVAAAEDTGGARRTIDSFARCRQIPAADARLACFDQAATELERSVRTNDIRIVDRADVRKARRSLFGLTVPDAALVGGRPDDDREAFTEINSTVTGARVNGNGRGDITLADEGAPVWQTTDPIRLAPKAGAAVRIRKGAMGGFFLNVGGRNYRAIRIR